jgi:uncharacterized protein (DUF697 family)/tellurite resistance protein
MQEQDREPVVTICLLAALVDGERSPEETVQFERIVARLGGTMPAAGAATIAQAAGRLSSPEARRMAYEMAVSVVYADGEANPRERQFLTELRAALELPPQEVEGLDQDALSLAEAPLALAVPEPEPGRRQLPKSLYASQGGFPTASPDAALDSLIRKQALLAGALELLPQNIASLAIIPVQMRLVYRIGADYGQRPDAAQVRDLLGAMGIGAAAQVLDGLSRRILAKLGRGLFGSALGGVMGGTAGAAVGAGLSFVTTYALGHTARQYYHQGRQLSREDLAALYRRFRREAEAILPAAQEQIHQQSQHMDFQKLLAAIRGVPANS